MTETATMTAAAAKALTSNRTGRAMYSASLVTSELFGEHVELRGPRGAVYRSCRNVNDGLHRFVERPVASYVFAVVNGVIMLPSETPAALERSSANAHRDALVEKFRAAGYLAPMRTAAAIMRNARRLAQNAGVQ